MAGDQANARARNAWLCFQDESGVCLNPPVRRTWAPRGTTPILRHPARRGKNLSMSAICCYRPDGSEARLAFALREGAYDTPSLVRQLDLLSSVLGGDPAIVIWDNLNVHKSHAMRAFVAAQAWLEVAWLPPYAPELNPAEGLWANLKGQELANHACRSTTELAATAQVGSFRVRRDQQLLLGFLRQAPLRL